MKPPYQPSDVDRRVVETMAVGGMSQEDICRAIGVSGKTLRKYFRDILNSAECRAKAQVVGTLFRMATSGKDVAATIFWCKTRLGWRDRQGSRSSKIVTAASQQGSRPKDQRRQAGLPDPPVAPE